MLLSNRFFFLALCFSAMAAGELSAQATASAERMADAAVSALSADTSWSEQTGLQLQGLDDVWYNTAKGDYFRAVRDKIDEVLAKHGDAGPIGSMENNLYARQLLMLYRVTQVAKYYDAATGIRRELAGLCDDASQRAHTRCTAEPFLAEYAQVFQQPDEFANLTRELQRWARVHSAHDRAELAAMLVDTLPYYAQDNPGRGELVTLLRRTVSIRNTASSTQDPLLMYALAKGARLGFLPAEDSAIAQQAWKGMSRSASTPNSGSLLIAAAELDLAPTATRAHGKTILLDAWYNSQQRKNAAGQMESFHYKWSDKSDSGYALLGHMFRSFGAATDTLSAAPTRESLSKAQYYMIVSPDIPVKNPNPHYMTAQDADEIAAWVKNGGVLVMMENDPPNADITHLNLLADRFGLHFDDVLHHHIIGEQVEDGRMLVNGNGPLFHHPHTLYMKDTCALSLSGSATALFKDRGDVVMATAKYGRGTVFAAVDPWLYNEYTDGRKNPHTYGQFDNFAGGMELVHWLLQQPQSSNNSAGKEDRKR